MSNFRGEAPRRRNVALRLTLPAETKAPSVLFNYPSLLHGEHLKTIYLSRESIVRLQEMLVCTVSSQRMFDLRVHAVYVSVCALQDVPLASLFLDFNRTHSNPNVQDKYKGYSNVKGVRCICEAQ